jgi:Galactose oxidase, central domain
MKRNSFLLMWLIAAALLVTMMPLPLSGQSDYSSPQWIAVNPEAPERVERTFHSGVYSPSTNRLIVFGGSVLGTTLRDLWVLTNANGLGGTPQWIKLSTAGSWPPARSRHTAVYDPGTDRMIIFGGCTSFCTPALNDVWVLKHASGATGPPAWQQLFPSGTWPTEREVATAVYDPASNSMILYGGDNGFLGGATADVWVLSHANGLGGTPQWTQLFPVGGPPTQQRWHSAVYDPTHNVMTVFGGYEGQAYTATNEVWTLTHANGTGGTPVWAKMDIEYGECPARVAHKAVYDPAANTMTIFGGSGDAGGLMNDVWVLWNANGLGGSHGWIQLNPTGTAPVPRAWPALTMDNANNRIILFGGNAQEGYTFTTWILTHGSGL